MRACLDRLIDNHRILAEKAGLSLVAEKYSPEFGGVACLIYTDGIVSLMVNKSRDGISYDCGNGEWQNDKWYSLDIIWNYLEQNSEYRKMNISNHFTFLQENFARIAEVFQSSEKVLTARKLHDLEISRSKKLFG
jgi:hypothetical protein